MKSPNSTINNNTRLCLPMSIVRPHPFQKKDPTRLVESITGAHVLGHTDTCSGSISCKHTFATLKRERSLIPPGEGSYSWHLLGLICHDSTHWCTCTTRITLVAFQGIRALTGTCLDKFVMEKGGLKLFLAHDHPCTGPSPTVDLENMEGTPPVRTFARLSAKSALSSSPVSLFPDSKILAIFGSVQTKKGAQGGILRRWIGPCFLEFSRTNHTMSVLLPKFCTGVDFSKNGLALSFGGRCQSDRACRTNTSDYLVPGTIWRG